MPGIYDPDTHSGPQKSLPGGHYYTYYMCQHERQWIVFMC